MSFAARRLRTPEERVGSLPNASLPPPTLSTGGPGASAPRALVAPDSLLDRALRDRDETAFATVLDTYFAAMLRIAQAHVGDRSAAEEVVQDTWIAALEAIHRFEGRASLRTWLFRILRNVARARARRDDRTRPMTALVPGDGELVGTDPSDLVVDGLTAAAGFGRGALWTRSRTPEDELLSSELATVLDAAIARLPRRQREVLLLREVEGWSAAEVCNVLGISDTNQRVILHRARDRVRNDLREYVKDGSFCRDNNTHDVH